MEELERSIVLTQLSSITRHNILPITSLYCQITNLCREIVGAYLVVIIIIEEWVRYFSQTPTAFQIAVIHSGGVRAVELSPAMLHAHILIKFFIVVENLVSDDSILIFN